MRFALPLVIAALAVPSIAATPALGQSVETGAPRGSLAVAAIERGDFTTAERLLAQSPLAANDPARLINTGFVLWAQGRRAEAVASWQAAADAPRPVALETVDGREVQSNVLARDILTRVARTAAR